MMANNKSREMMTDTKSLVTEREAARMLNISMSTLRRRRIGGRRPNYIRLGRLIRYTRSEIEAVIKENSTEWKLF